MVSDIRKKLSKNNINPDIITPLGPDVDINTKVSLQIKAINNLNDKHEKSKEYVLSINLDVTKDESQNSHDYIDDLDNGNKKDESYMSDSHFDDSDSDEF